MGRRDIASAAGVVKAKDNCGSEIPSLMLVNCRSGGLRVEPRCSDRSSGTRSTFLGAGYQNSPGGNKNEKSR